MDRPSRSGDPTGPADPRGSAEERLKLAEAVREACTLAAIEAYEEAGLAGLCDEGRWEAAVDRLRTFKLEPVLRQMKNE